MMRRLALLLPLCCCPLVNAGLILGVQGTSTLYQVAENGLGTAYASLPFNVKALEFNPVTGELYLVRDDGGLYTYSLTGGTAFLVQNLPASTLDIAFDQSGRLFYSTWNTLTRMDLATGASTPLGTVPYNAFAVANAGADGLLRAYAYTYAFRGTFDFLTLSPETGAMVTVTATTPETRGCPTFYNPFWPSLTATYDSSTGAFYSALGMKCVYDGSGGGDEGSGGGGDVYPPEVPSLPPPFFLNYDTTTGTASTYDNRIWSGLAVQDDGVATPEPLALGLMAVGILAVAAGRRYLRRG